MEEEDDDPVVEEIPVYLSQALSENLYIYQYPVRPGNRDWSDVRVVNAAIKPQNQMVRLEVEIDTESDNYCPSKGENIAVNTDGMQGFIEPSTSKSKEKEKAPYFSSNVMDKIVYESSMPCTEMEQYAVAILQDKELHLTPLKGIHQLRPSHSYFDKQDKRKPDKSKTDSDDEDKEVQPQQVTVKFARQETDVVKKAREKSFEAVTQRIKEEPWFDALYRGVGSDDSDLERLKLFSSTTADGPALSISPHEYVRALVPAPPDDEADVVVKRLPTVSDQIREVLINAKLMQFSDLRRLIRTADGPLTEIALLSALSGAACCVRGLWAARSADLYTNAAPVPPRLMCAARDHVLYLFTQSPYVDRRKVAAAVRLPPTEVLQIMESVAKYNSNVGEWQLIIPPDVAFEEKYPDVIQRQNMYWEARQRLFNDMLIGETVPKRQRKKSQRDSTSSDTLMSPKSRCNSVSEEDSDKKRQKNKCASGGGKRTRNVSSSSAQDT